MFFTSAKALTVEIPILIPVKDPGPWQHANKSISSSVKFACLNV